MKEIELIARAVIKARGDILLCRSVGADWYFLPGGHVELGETAAQSLKRELFEELGARAGSCQLIGAAENIYGQGNKKRHELNLFYQVALKGKNAAVSKEPHIEFKWVPLQTVPKLKLMPLVAKKGVLAWISDKKFFTNL